MQASGFREVFEEILIALQKACESHYGERLITLSIFGSVGRGTFGPESDIDLLIIADALPSGRVRRSDDFASGVEERLTNALEQASLAGVQPRLSPVFKTPQEASAGSPLFLDMTEDAQILFDRNNFFTNFLARFRERLTSLGSRRVWIGNRWYWELKPDLKPGEVVEI